MVSPKDTPRSHPGPCEWILFGNRASVDFIQTWSQGDWWPYRRENVPEQTGVQAQGHVTAGRPRASEEAWPWAPGFPVPNLRDCDRDTQFAVFIVTQGDAVPIVSSV